MDLKKLIGLLAVVFVVFWLFQDPRGLASTAGDGVGWVVNAGEATFRQLLEFIDGL